MSDEQKTWKTYEEVAAYLLNQIATEFGLERIEGKQKVVSQSAGVKYEIDAKGVGEGNEIFFIVECKRNTTSRINQGKVNDLAWRIRDTGAEGGIVVSPLGLQKGADKLAQSNIIYSVKLDEKSTRSEYVLEFLHKVRVGNHLEGKVPLKSSLSIQVIYADGRKRDIGEV